MADSYGSFDIIDGARDVFETVLIALMAELTTTTATYNYVYNQHHKALMKLNAVSIDVERITPEISGQAQGLYSVHVLQVSVRFHNGFMGAQASDPVDTQESGRVIDSIINYFMERLNINANYKIENIIDINIYEEFSASRTFGSSVTFEVHYYADHNQV